jgi:hypothetical protein
VLEHWGLPNEIIIQEDDSPVPDKCTQLSCTEMVKRLSQRKAINQVSKEKPLIRCHLSLKLKGVYEKSDSHRDEENRRSQSGMRINGCVDCVHLCFTMATNSHCFASVPGLACFAMVVN